MNNSLKHIGIVIKDLRLQYGYSQKYISMLSGVERAQLSRIEKGEVKGVAFLTIEKILNALNKTLTHREYDDSKYDIHPFVKWAGGKTQLLTVIKRHMPKKYNRYFEPFVGGGALFFDIQPKYFVINDNNSELMCIYKCFLNDTSYSNLVKLLDEYEQNHSEEFYYNIRNIDKNENYCKLSVSERAARALYLNKACFNGLYRVNSNGYFNVPFGKKEKVHCYDNKNFENLKLFFQTKIGKVLNTDFETAVKDARKHDFVYFDPPYDVIDGKNSFTSYGKNTFGKEEQKRLRNVFVKLANKGVKVMLSNHNTAYIRELYKDYNITVVPAKRIINSKGDGRGEVEEVIITNYEVIGDLNNE